MTESAQATIEKESLPKDASNEPISPPDEGRKAAPDSEEESPLSQRLQEAPIEEAPRVVSEAERTTLAKKRIGATLKTGHRLTKLYGVGVTTATYEATKGPGDAGERAVVRMLLGDVAKSERAKSHFLRAAYAASRFTHPRIVPVTADGLDDEGVPYTLRGYHDAEPVTRSAKELDEQRVLRIAEQLLDILEIAHAHGIVHGAIRPENVLMTSRGSARLVDFSVPPGLGARKDDESPLPSLRLGPFTPPERCVPAHEAFATEQGDIWAIGAVMFFALTGEPPRGDAKGREALAAAKIRALRDLKKDASEPLANVVDHALTADPALRYESAYAMLGDIRRVLAGRPPKLANATGPVPSGVLADSSGGPPSTFRPPPFRTAGQSPQSQRGAAPSQWKGNVTLIVLIAAILAAATYVMVREKTEEHEKSSQPAPATS